MPVEIGRFEPVLANIIIGRLQAEGIVAVPLPSYGAYRQLRTRILVDDEDVGAARKIILAARPDLA